jgi:hypothetical protein
MPKGDFKARLVAEACANLHKEKKILTAESIKTEANRILKDNGSPYHRRNVCDISVHQIPRLVLKTKCARKKGYTEINRAFSGKDKVIEYEYVPPIQR